MCTTFNPFQISKTFNTIGAPYQKYIYLNNETLWNIFSLKRQKKSQIFKIQISLVAKICFPKIFFLVNLIQVFSQAHLQSLHTKITNLQNSNKSCCKDMLSKNFLFGQFDSGIFTGPFAVTPYQNHKSSKFK